MTPLMNPRSGTYFNHQIGRYQVVVFHGQQRMVIGEYTYGLPTDAKVQIEKRIWFNYFRAAGRGKGEA